MAMPGPAYDHSVYVGLGDNSGRRGSVYDGTSAADAMAAWSKAVLDGAEYVTLESLRKPAHQCRAGCEHDPGDGHSPLTGIARNE